jgi:hypothetical protein
MLTGKSLNIEIAEEVLRLDLEKCTRGFYRAFKSYLQPFLIPSGRNGCIIRVLPYRQKHRYVWQTSTLAKWRELFFSVQNRFPPTVQLEKRVQQSLGILQHFNPETPPMQMLTFYIDTTQKLVCALVGVDLFVYNPELDTAFFLIKRRLRRAGTLMAVINGIMCVLSHQLIHSGGLLLHGAAVQKNGHTVLFLGLSGAGKSTAARLCDPDVCFSDDGVVIKNQGNRVYAFCSPFSHVKGNGYHTGPMQGEIRKMFLLEKSTYTKVSPIAPNELMSIILRHLIHFYKYLTPETARLGFANVKTILDLLPAFRLQFAKNTKLWDNIMMLS